MISAVTRVAVKGAFFDLDLTLVDSRISASARKSRNWAEVYSLVPQFTVFPGVRESLEDLRTRLRLGVVSNGPRPYVTRVLQHFALNISDTACYHDTASHKPAPDPILHLANRLALKPAEVAYIGDEPNDIRAANAAGVFAIAATWGTNSIDDLLQAKPDAFARTPRDLLEII